MHRCTHTFRFRELHILEQGSQSWRPRVRIGAETTQDLRHITIPSEFRIPRVWAQGSIFLKAPLEVLRLLGKVIKKM